MHDGGGIIFEMTVLLVEVVLPTGEAFIEHYSLPRTLHSPGHG
jgi:hypothetical protein